MRFFGLITLLLLLSTNTFAMFCPNNFNNINIGDTLEKVRAQCGNPSSENSFTGTSNSGSEEWTYYKKPNFSVDKNLVKMKLLISDNKLVNINITNNNTGRTATCVTTAQATTYNNPVSMNCNIPPSNVNVTNTSLCGLYIKTGLNAQDIITACGRPDSVIKNQQQDSQNSGIAVTEWKYQGPSTVTLVFENGKLTERK